MHYVIRSVETPRRATSPRRLGVVAHGERALRDFTLGALKVLPISLFKSSAPTGSPSRGFGRRIIRCALSATGVERQTRTHSPRGQGVLDVSVAVSLKFSDELSVAD